MNLGSTARDDEIDQAIVNRLTILAALSTHRQGVPIEELSRALDSLVGPADVAAGLERLRHRSVIYGDETGYRVRSVSLAHGRAIRGAERIH